LEGFPALAAALLKYKKHEWVIIGFEKNREIDYIWLNKGQDNSQVRVRMSYAQMVNHARSGGHTTVIVLHNHPNPDPTTQSLLCPSKPDALSAQGLESALLPASINLLEFVCERGRFAEYHRAIAPSFMPIDDFIADVAAENGKTRGGNLLLHLERF
jgi:DNA repair protein RadC